MKKKLLAIIAAMSMAVAFALPAFAAGGISAQEQELLNKFKAGVVVDGKTITPPQKYIAQAENYLKNDDLTADEISKVSATIDKVYSTMKDEGITSLSELKASSSYNSLLSEVKNVASSLGYTVSVGANGFTVTTPGGSTVGGGSSIKPNQTGVDMTATVVSVIALVAVLSGSAVVIGKKNLLAE